MISGNLPSYQGFSDCARLFPSAGATSPTAAPRRPRSPLCPSHRVLAASSSRISPALSASSTAFAKLFSCSTEVALAIGAATLWRTIDQTSAIAAGVLPCRSATRSSARRIERHAPGAKPADKPVAQGTRYARPRERGERRQLKTRRDAPASDRRQNCATR